MRGSNFTIGITDASQIKNDRLQTSGYTPFVSRDISKRLDPKRIFSDAKSIVVVCVPYDTADFYSNLSSLGVCDDYHKRVKDVLMDVAANFEDVYGPFNHKILVDGPTLCERTLAVRAGLGFFGKNGLVISPEYGTRFNIGVMITSVLLDESHKTMDLQACSHDCNLCIEACPNGALSEGKPLEAGLCISYLTQKEKLTAEEEKLLHGQLYGCDICQNVCPKNTPHKSTYLNPEDLLILSESEIAERFNYTAMSWKIKLLKRNAKNATQLACL